VAVAVIAVVIVADAAVMTVVAVADATATSF
jgi:hypothetical protein